MDMIQALNKIHAEKREVRMMLEKEAWRDKRLVAKWLWWQAISAFVIMFVALFILTPMFIGWAIILTYLNDEIMHVVSVPFLFSIALCGIGIIFVHRRSPIDSWVSEEMKKRFGE